MQGQAWRRKQAYDLLDIDTRAESPAKLAENGYTVRILHVRSSIFLPLSFLTRNSRPSGSRGGAPAILRFLETSTPGLPRLRRSV